MVGEVISIGASRGAAATKDRILDAAEALFMEHGFEATSLRAITAAAEVNLAAVNYHFGSKEELFQAMLTRRLDPMNQERVDLLDALEREAGARPGALRAHPGGDVHPGAATSRATRRAAARTSCACSGRAYADPAPFIRQFLSEQYAVMIARFKAAFGRALPQLSEARAVVAPALHHGRAVVHAGRHRRAEAHRRAHAGEAPTTTKSCCSGSRRSCWRACTAPLPDLATTPRRAAEPRAARALIARPGTRACPTTPPHRPS